MTGKFDIFISWHHDCDREWARKLSQGLKERGLSVWLDVEQLKPGREWSRRLLEALEESSHVVFILGPGSAKSNAVALELGMALGQGKQIIPVVDPNVSRDDIPGPIRRRHYLKKDDPQIVAEEIADALAALKR